MKLGSIVREYRIRTGKPVENILHYVGISRRTYYLWESGVRLPSVEKLEKLAKFFAENILGEDYEKVREKLSEAYRHDLRLHISAEYKEKEIIERLRGAEEKISEVLLKDMKEKRMPPSELAARTGIEESKLAEILTGFRIPAKEELKKIAKALEQPVEKYSILMTEEEMISIVIRDIRIRRILRDLYTLNDRKRELAIDIIERILELHKLKS